MRYKIYVERIKDDEDVISEAKGRIIEQSITSHSEMSGGGCCIESKILLTNSPYTRLYPK